MNNLPTKVDWDAIVEGLAAAYKMAADAMSLFVAAASTSMNCAVNWSIGYSQGFAGEPRDWSMPNAWHRGYLHGRLARVKKRHAADTPHFHCLIDLNKSH